MRLYVIFLALFSNTYALLDHHWHVIGHKNDFQPNIPKKITINNSPISTWRDKNNHFAGISDVCPHRGESLSKAAYLYHRDRLGCPNSTKAVDLLHTRYHAVPKLEQIAPLASKWWVYALFNTQSMRYRSAGHLPAPINLGLEPRLMMLRSWELGAIRWQYV